jgi:signal peptidase I
VSQTWRSRIPGWVEVPAIIVVALLIVFLLKTFVVQAFYIPSGSMENTLQVGDRVVVNKVVYHLRPVQRGDVIVFDGSGIFTPEVDTSDNGGPLAVVGRVLGALFGIAAPSEHDFIKRVIGVGGDRVVCCNTQRQITVNGIALDESSYLYGKNPPSREPFDVLVPDGKLWVMGDHRSASADSRAHMGDPGGGFVPLDRVLGRAFAVVWPLSDAQVLELPSTFDQPGLTQADGGN